MKRIIPIILIIALIPLTTGLALEHKTAISNPDLTRDRSGSSISFNDNTKTKSNSALLTKWVWDGNNCKKQDIVTIPFLVNRDSKLNTGYVEVTGPHNAPEGKRWASKIIEGKYGIVVKNKKLDLTPDCDESIVETKPLLISWWLNNR